jgi:hypothetical protein
MAKFRKVFSLSDLGIKDIESLTSKQKAKAIRAYVARRGDKLDAKVRGRALMRAGRYEKESGAAVPKKSKSATGLWAVSLDSDGVKVFKNKSAKLYGITPAEYADFKGFKTIKKSKKFQAKRRARA